MQNTSAYEKTNITILFKVNGAIIASTTTKANYTFEFPIGTLTTFSLCTVYIIYMHAEIYLYFNTKITSIYGFIGGCSSRKLVNNREYFDFCDKYIGKFWRNPTFHIHRCI